MTMFKKCLAGIVMMFVAGIGGYAAYSSVAPNKNVVENAAASARSIDDIQTEQGKPVRVEAVKQEDIEVTQTFYGTATPCAEANVQGKYGGRLVFLKGEEGEMVTQGDTIVKFEEKDTQLQLQQAIAAQNTAEQSVNEARSNYETTQTNLKRYQKLFADGFISRQDLDSLQNKLLVAQAGLQSAQEQVKNKEAQIQLYQNMLHDLKISAPISGVIDEKHFNLNEIPDPGDVIYHIINIDQVYVEVDVPETYISKIHEQMAVRVLFDSLNPEQQFTGTVERIIPTGNAQSRNFVAKVLIENPERQIKPGMFARVNVCVEQIPGALVFNKKALLKEGEDYYVFKAAGTRAQKVAVTVKYRESSMVAVASEQLQAHDQIVIEGARMLQSNDRMNILGSS
jgi:RND family efflux transporter MFP subunit